MTFRRPARRVRKTGPRTWQIAWVPGVHAMEQVEVLHQREHAVRVWQAMGAVLYVVALDAAHTNLRSVESDRNYEGVARDQDAWCKASDALMRVRWELP